MILSVETLAALVAAMHLISTVNDCMSLQVFLKKCNVRMTPESFVFSFDDKLTTRLNVLLHTGQG